MVHPFFHYNPNHRHDDEMQYDQDETSEEDWANTGPRFPFFQNTYSYGDPRGGRYPDPTMHQLRPSEQPEDGLTADRQTDVLQTELFEDNDFDALLGQVPNDPENDPDFSHSELEDEESQEDLSASESDPEADITERQGPIKAVRAGRGRGRGRGRGVPRAAGRGSAKSASGPSTRGGRGGRRGGRKHGPRPHAEPTQEFKRLNGMLTEAFLKEDWDAALSYGREAIQINPEAFPVHATIADILVRRGRVDDALTALFVGVTPERDPDTWRYVIEQLLELGGDTKETRQRLQDCYSALLDINPEDYPARIGRMRNYRRSGQNIRAKNECHNLLKRNPYDMEVLNHLAEACFALGQPAAALPAFESFISHCLENDRPEDSKLDWVFLDYYADMLIQLQEWDAALKVITSVSRWLLGRAEETFWNLDKDDREWDVEDEPRRIKVLEFTHRKYDDSTYGQGLLVELREKMGLARLGKGSSHTKEALVGTSYLRMNCRLTYFSTTSNSSNQRTRLKMPTSLNIQTYSGRSVTHCGKLDFTKKP
jgi:general transcription factor 3C polypeptide 3 (transcription factor C subunit 4)